MLNYKDIQSMLGRQDTLPSTGMTPGLFGSELSLLTPGLVAFLSIII